MMNRPVREMSPAGAFVFVPLRCSSAVDPSAWPTL